MGGSAGKESARLTSRGGSVPIGGFGGIVGLPGLWVPHSYPGCGQHAPDEHLPIAIAREGLAIMTRLFWDLHERGAELLVRLLEHQKGGAK